MIAKQLLHSETENWQYSNGTSLVSPTLINSTLTPGSANIITTSEDAIQTSANNDAFSNATRSARYEGARYLNNLLMVRGNTAHITGDSGSFDIDASKYIQLTGQSFNFSKNSSADLLKIAFSLVNVDGDSIVVPDNVRIMVEFTNNDGTQYAQLQAVLSDSLEFFDSNRYFVATKRFDELVYSTTFSWDAISIVKIYACVSDTISATNIEATAGTVTLTTASHGVPVNATITNVTALGGEVTYTSTNTFSPGDVVTITGVTSTPSNVFNLTNVTFIESTGSLFRVASTATGTYTSGGTAKMSAQKITFDHGTAPYTGTHIITSVPSSTSLEYYVDGASVTSTALSPNGTVDISRPEYFIALDAIRMDNVATVNPLYGLTGYTIIQNADATTITKNPNTNNYVEFRINLGVY
jgi:hypothetical protein